MCTKWFLGTGSGDGRTSMFENRDDAKYEKYGVDKNTYDHHDILNQPTILINNYHKHRYPYLTMIHLWDESKSFLLSSRYDPLHSGKGESGMPRDDESISVLSSSSSNRRLKRSNRGRDKSKSPNHKDKSDNSSSGSIRDTMREMITLLAKNATEPPTVKQSKDVPDDSSNTSIEHWYKLYDKHVNHMKFLKENELFTGQRKSDVLKNIDSVYAEITRESSGKRSRDNDSDLDSNSNSKVS